MTTAIYCTGKDRFSEIKRKYPNHLIAIRRLWLDLLWAVSSAPLEDLCAKEREGGKEKQSDDGSHRKRQEDREGRIKFEGEKQTRRETKRVSENNSSMLLPFALACILSITMCFNF